MANSLIDIALEGLEQVIGAVKDTQARYDHLEKPFKQSTVILFASVMENFSEQGRPEAWEPLSPLTLMLRRKGGGGGSAKILQDTGLMRNSIAPFWDEEESIFGLTMSGPHSEFGRLMQEGGQTEGGPVDIPRTTRVSKNGKEHTVKAHTANIGPHAIPPRPFLIAQEDDKEKIVSIFLAHLDGNQ